MRSLKVRTFKEGGTTPDTTITVPLAILRVEKKLRQTMERIAMDQNITRLKHILKPLLLNSDNNLFILFVLFYLGQNTLDLFVSS